MDEMSEREQELHRWYAQNARARGHAETCALIATPRNWPTILGRPECTCVLSDPLQRRADEIHAADVAEDFNHGLGEIDGAGV